MRLLIAAALLAALPALAQTSLKATPPDSYIFKSAGEIDALIIRQRVVAVDDAIGHPRLGQ